MALTVNEKEAIIAQVAEVANTAHSALAFSYAGIAVNDMNQLRADARSSGVYLQVVKNTLAKRAMSGTDFECMNDNLQGSLLLAFSMDDPGSAARLLKAFKKDQKTIEIKAISIGGKLLNSEDLDTLARMPTKDQAISMLMSVMKAPVTKLAATLIAPHVKLVRTIVAVNEQKESA